jgi:hypothetical protein
MFGSVADLHHIYADPDPTFQFDADPDPTHSLFSKFGPLQCYKKTL